MKIGVLYPRSNAHPNMMVDFVEGIKTALNHGELNDKIQLVTESIGFGGVEKEVYEKAEKLFMLESVDILVAYIDLRVLSLLEPLVYANGKLLIVVNTGANYPQNWVPQPNIIYLTLQHGFICWLTGGLAAKNGHTRAAIVTSFYDCGYLHTAAMTNAFVKKNGEIRHNHVNKGRYDETFEIKTLTDFLSTDKETDTLLCVLDDKPAALFYDRLNNYEGAAGLHVFVSPMMLEEKALEQSGEGFHFSVDGYMPYDAGTANANNTVFRTVYKEQTKKETSLFVLQGWETGLVLQEIFTACKEKYTDAVLIKDHLTSVVINSPRGELSLDKETHYFRAPVYKAFLEKNTNKISITPAGNVEEEWETFVANPVTGPSSGWTNSYLCY